MEELKKSINENYKKLECSIDKIELLLLYLKKIINETNEESDLLELDLELQNLMINFSYPVEKEIKFVKILNNLLNNLTLKTLSSINSDDLNDIINRIEKLQINNGK